jgi:uncharacterized protein
MPPGRRKNIRKQRDITPMPGKPKQKLRTSKNEQHFEEFRCVRCGRCCMGDGFVSLDDDECQTIADSLGISLETFLTDYTRWENGYARWLADGEGEDQPCIFLLRDADGLASCRIQGDAKPRQCLGFPAKWHDRGFEKWCAAFNQEKDK